MARPRTDHSATRHLLDDLREALDTALGEVVARPQFKGKVRSMSLGKCLFDPAAGSFDFKLNGVFSGGESKEETNYRWLRERQKLHGVSLPDLGAVFSASHDGFRHTIVGANTGDGIITLRSDGQRRIWRTPAQVALLVGRPETEHKRTAAAVGQTAYLSYPDAEVPPPGRSNIGEAS